MDEIFASVLSIIILISGMYAVLFVFYLNIKKHERTTRLPVDRTKLIRVAGYGLNKQVNDKALDILGITFGATVCILMPFAFNGLNQFIKNHEVPYLFIIIIIPCIAYSMKKSWKSATELRKLKLGYDAEIACASELIYLQSLGYQVFHDVQADGFNIDHLVVGRNGIFAIETKGRHKRIKDKANGNKDYLLEFENNALKFPSWVETKPIEQATNQAKWVQKWLTQAVGSEVKVLPVLVFPGWFVALKSKPPFAIINHKQIAKTIPSINGMSLDQTQINAICYQVVQRSMNGDNKA